MLLKRDDDNHDGRWRGSDVTSTAVRRPQAVAVWLQRHSQFRMVAFHLDERKVHQFTFQSCFPSRAFSMGSQPDVYEKEIISIITIIHLPINASMQHIMK